MQSATILMLTDNDNTKLHTITIQIKKTLTILTLTIFISLSLFSQDSIQSPKSLLRPYVESGVDFIGSEILRQNYETKSKYYFGVGFQFGNSDTQKLFPYLQFTYSIFEFEHGDIDIINESFTSKQLSGGFVIPIKQMSDIKIRSRIGYSYALIKETSNDIEANSNGFQVGVGFETKIFRKSKLYFDLIYNYQKTINSDFKDYDMTKLAVGFVI